ncbi:MAG: PD40 domain-containing protein [Prevotella sp.]|nr:PD40 domain-containing protein [Prevotella sp.]
MKKLLIFSFLCVILLTACHQAKVPSQFEQMKQQPVIYPDYIGVTVPVNIAPLHFQLTGNYDEVVTRFSVADEEVVLGGRTVCPDFDEWKQLVGKSAGSAPINIEMYARVGEKWQRYEPFTITVSADSIDPWLTYRLISPSYVTYEELTINQRCLENYDERVVYDNMLCSTEADGQCINCHYCQLGNPERTLFHARQNLGGTMLNIDGKLTKVNLKTDSTLSAGVYPAWHPKQNLIAFSTNMTMQSFHTRDVDKIEVFDKQSDLILYDPETNEVSTIENEENEFETFPCWSPDGQWLYYSSAHFEWRDTVSHEAECIRRYKDIKYNVYRKAFDVQTRSFGPRELVFQADTMNLSATLPRISPDGRFLLLAVGEWGTFHIWHRDADLWLMDLKSGEIGPMKEANSPSVESFHNWSSNGRWIVVSSRRDDGNFTRPFFAHVDQDGHASKPFELPTDDPNYHREFMKSYNVPEFMRGPVTVKPQTFADALKKPAVAAKYKQ